MNRQLTSAELGSMLLTDKPMSRRDKLLHLADLVRRYKGHPECGDRLVIFSNLEQMSSIALQRSRHPASAFALAAADPQFQAAGLKSDDAYSAMQFFELTQDELHEFSCDCGGMISNDNMAHRIEQLAKRK